MQGSIVLLYPELLARGTEGHQQDSGARAVDLLDDTSFLVVRKLAVVGARDLQAGEPLLHVPGGDLGDAGTGAEQVD